MPQAFRCTIVTPEQPILDERVTHVSIPAWDGQVGLLHQRAPLLAKLGYGPLELDLEDGSKRRYFVGGGFAQMKNDELAVLTDEAIPAGELDREQAEAELKEAQARRAVEEPEIDRREREVARARAMRALAAEAG